VLKLNVKSLWQLTPRGCNVVFFIIFILRFFLGKKLKVPNILQLIRNSSGEDETPNWREVYFILRNFIWKKINADGKNAETVSADDVVTCLQTKKG